MVENLKGHTRGPKLIGAFIRQRRETLRLSQRALGQLFDPPVTTQFISNVERGVTPLPPAHVPTLAKALAADESEIMSLLEREYAAKLSGRLGKEGAGPSAPGSGGHFAVDSNDYDFMRAVYDAYRSADQDSRKTFETVCQTILKVTGSAQALAGAKGPGGNNKV